MNTSEIKLHNILREKFNEKDTVELVECINTKIKSEVDTRSNIFLTKDDKIDLINRIEITKSDLMDRINRSKTETIIWIVGVGVLQFLLTIITKKIL